MTTAADVIAVEEVIDDAVDVALAATDMDTSLFVPIAVRRDSRRYSSNRGDRRS